MSTPIDDTTTIWANAHVRQSSLGLICVGEHATLTPYTIKPLVWVYNGNMNRWETPTLFGRLILYSTYSTAEWMLQLPLAHTSHRTRIEALRHAWEWYVNELRVKALDLADPDDDTLDSHTGMTEDERRNIG